MSRYGVFSGPIFPHSGWIQNAGEYRPEKPLYLKTFHAVLTYFGNKSAKTLTEKVTQKPFFVFNEIASEIDHKEEDID